MAVKKNLILIIIIGLLYSFALAEGTNACISEVRSNLNMNTTEELEKESSSVGKEIMGSVDLAIQKAMTVRNNAAVRKSPNKASDKIVSIKTKGSELDVVDNTNGTDGYTWYLVNYTTAKGKVYRGYIREDLIQLNNEQVRGNILPLDESANEKMAVSIQKESVKIEGASKSESVAETIQNFPKESFSTTNGDESYYIEENDRESMTISLGDIKTETLSEFEQPSLSLEPAKENITDENMKLKPLMDRLEKEKKADEYLAEMEDSVVLYRLQNNNAIIIRVLPADTTLYLPGIIEGHAVIAIGNGEPVLDLYSPIKEIFIGDGVQIIGEYAFSDQGELTKAELADSVIAIEAYAFAGCEKMTEMEFSPSIQTFGESIFSRTPVQSLVFPEGVESISGANAFLYCNELKKISFPSTLKTIGNGVFCWCGIESIVLPEGLESIGDGAFQQCGKLKEVVFPDSLKTIGADAFSGTALTAVTIPDQVTYLGARAFKTCTGLKSLQLSDALTDIEDECFAYSAITSLELPEGLKRIGCSAFEFCKKLGKVKLPDSLMVIDDKAFSVCSSLKSISIPNAVEIIGKEAFSSCDKLKKIDMPKSMKSIGSGAFLLTGITSIIVPEGIESIEDKTFENCRSLKKIRLPSTLKKIGEYAFYETGLTSVKFPDGLEVISPNAFYRHTITEIIIPAGVRKIETGAFAGKNNCPQKVTFLGKSTELALGIFGAYFISDKVYDVYTIKKVPYKVHTITLICYPASTADRLYQYHVKKKYMK